jgi:hypothetical protein
MKIDKVHFHEYVMLPGQVNGRTKTIFARDVDRIELLPNGVRVERGAVGAFFFDKTVNFVEYEVVPSVPSAPAADKPLKVEKGKSVKIEFAETNE